MNPRLIGVAAATSKRRRCWEYTRLTIAVDEKFERESLNEGRSNAPQETSQKSRPKCFLSGTPQLSALRRVAALDKTQPEAQIPANPANHRTNSVVTGRPRVVGNQQSGRAVTFLPDSRFHRRSTWRPQLEYSIRTITLKKR